MGKPSRRRAFTTLIQDKERMTRSFARKLEPALISMFASQTTEAARRIESGKNPVSDSVIKKWSAQWIDTQFSLLSTVSHTGGQLALMQLGIQADQVIKAAGTDIGIAFDLDDYQRPLKAWLEKVASFSTRIHAGRIDRIWEQARREGNDVAKITKQIKEEMPYFGTSRARMIALTNTNWCMNSGMRQEHRKMGVNVFEWMTSKDDSVCPFCGRMDRVKVQGDDPFWNEGTVFGVNDKNSEGASVLKTLKLKYEIYHPPLHPKCVCTLLPVLTTTNVLIDGSNNAGDYPAEYASIITDMQDFAKASAKLKVKIPNKPPDLGIHGTGEMTGKELLESIRQMDKQLDEFYPEVLNHNSTLQDMLQKNAKKLDRLQKGERELILDWYHKGFEYRDKGDLLEELVQKAIVLPNSKKTSIFYKGSDDIIEAIEKAKIDDNYRNGINCVNKAMDFVNSITDKAVSGEHPVIRICHLPGIENREYHQAGTIYVKIGRRDKDITPMDVIVHELGHGIDYKAGSGYGVTKKLKPLYKERTKDDHLERFTDIFPNLEYGDDEVFKRDKWKERGWDLYIGKDYSGEPKEMASMCYQQLFDSAVKFSRNDPELFELFIDIIRAKGR